MSSSSTFTTTKDTPPAEVCESEALRWLDCLEPKAEKPATAKATWDNSCVIERQDFDKCVVQWRAAINDSVENPKVKVKGDAAGLPPPQCAPLSCLFQKCFMRSNYDSQLCKFTTMNFKHCCKLMYGAEYID